MNNDRLGRFLNGQADDEEFKLCETLLEDAHTIVDEDAVDKSDPLVASLRAASSVAMGEDDSSRQLVERIEGVVAQQLIGRDEIERLLDAPQQADELGRIGRYRVIEFIAAGGMGLVFKADDTHLNRLVCIKIMRPALALKPDARLRFERESRAAAQLRSERIVTLLDIGVQRELPYIVMQLLDGESLRAKLSREGKVSVQLAVHYLTQIAEGLRHAHAMGILHRDIKPDNIWITATGDIKLLDFGLARPFEESGNLTTTGGLIGTPQYMSPEQIQGHTLDARSDLFSLGVVLFEMLTGDLPFQKNNLFSTMIAITSDSVSLPALESASPIARDVEDICHRLLKKNANERIQSAQELMEQLSRLGSSPTEAQAITAHERALPLADPSRGRSNRMRYVLVGVASGLVAMLLLMLLMQVTDKGTLQVRSNDPQVEVRIAQEKVHIKDPLSGKSYEIQIGKTRLPGGVYQLEMNDATSGLTFSSNTIAIRRGETVVVEVELQPKTQDVATNERNPTTENETQTPGTTDDSKVSLKNADPSFQLKAREDFARTLASLPAQSIDLVARRSGGFTQPYATDQSKLEGIDSWSIDTNAFAGSGARYNSDQTLLATVRDNTVQIWNKSLELKYILRSSLQIGLVHFDNRYPNLIAASAYVGAGDLPGEYKYEVTVWRLGDDYAEIIYRLPCKGGHFAWDQGYRLFYQGNDGLAVFRLDENKGYELHVPRGTMLENAVSTNGRFLATQNGANIDVWDLHRGEFAFASLNNSRVQWNQQGDRAAFFAHQGMAFEIWDLEKRAIDDRVELPSEPVAQQQNGLKTAVFGLEPTFGRVAWLSPQGKLSVRNLRNNREDSQPLPNSANSRINYASVQWQESSLIVEADQASFVWTHDKSDVEGTLTERKPSALMAMKQGVPLNFTHVIGHSTPVLHWQDTVASERNRNMPTNGRDRQAELYFDAFDMSTNRLVHETPLSQLRTSSYASSSVARNLWGPPYVSLDGRYAIAPSLEVPRESTLMAFSDAGSPKKLELSGEVTQWSEGNGVTTLWDKHSRFAFMADARNSSSGPRPLYIYDAETKSFVDQSKLAIPEGKIIDIGRSHRGFVVVTKLTSRDARSNFTPGPQSVPLKYSGKLEVWRVDPQAAQLTKAEAATKLLAKLGTVGSIVATDSYLFICAVESQGNADTSKTVRKYFRIALDGELGSHVGCVTLSEIDDLYFAANGEDVLREARDAEIVGVVTSSFGRVLQFSTKGPSTLYHARWSDIAKDLGELDMFEKLSATDDDRLKPTEFKRVLSTGQLYESASVQWHPTHDVVAWRENGYSNFFAPKDDEQRKIGAWLGGPLIAANNGWVRADRNAVQFFEVSGKPIGELMFDPYLENMKPSRPRWRLSDGSLATECGIAGLAISYQKGSRFYCESVEEFEGARPDIKLPRTSVTSRLEPRK